MNRIIFGCLWKPHNLFHTNHHMILPNLEKLNWIKNEFSAISLIVSSLVMPSDTAFTAFQNLIHVKDVLHIYNEHSSEQNRIIFGCFMGAL